MLAFGRAHERLGGAGRTIDGYTVGLSAEGRKVALLYISAGEKFGVRDNSGTGQFARAIPRFEVSGRATGCVRMTWASVRRSNPRVVLVFGVWHPVFFALVTLRVIAPLVGCHFRLVLIPTMSLSPYDIGKRRQAKRLLLRFGAFATRRIDLVVFSSSGELEYSADLGVPGVVLKEPLSSGLGDIVADLDRVVSIDGRTRRIIWTGRIDPQKDLSLLLRSFERCDEQCRLVIVGDGDPEYVAEMKQLAADIGVASRVEWMGWATGEFLARAIASCNVQVVTSREENFCHSAFEALSCARELVIVDRILSAPELGEAGALVVPATPEDIAIGVQVCLGRYDANASARVGYAQRLRELHSPARIARELEMVLESADSR